MSDVEISIVRERSANDPECMVRATRPRVLLYGTTVGILGPAILVGAFLGLSSRNPPLTLLDAVDGEVHLGEALAGETIRGSIALRNDSTASITINKLVRSCGCTSSSLELPVTIDPQGTLAIPLEVKVSQGGGDQVGQITVYAAGYSKSARFPFRIVKYRILPDSIDLGYYSLVTHRPYSVRFDPDALDKMGLALDRITSSPPVFEFVPDQDGRGVQMVAAIPEASPGPILAKVRAFFTSRDGGLASHEQSLLVKGHFFHTIRVEPDFIIAGRVRRGVPRPRWELALSSDAPFRVARIEANDHFFDVILNSREDLRVTYSAHLKPHAQGSLDEVITFVTEQEERIPVRIKGMVQ